MEKIANSILFFFVNVVPVVFMQESYRKNKQIKSVFNAGFFLL
jgi:hypothetical protein